MKLRVTSKSLTRSGKRSTKTTKSNGLHIYSGRSRSRVHIFAKSPETVAECKKKVGEEMFAKNIASGAKVREACGTETKETSKRCATAYKAHARRGKAIGKQTDRKLVQCER